MCIVEVKLKSRPPIYLRFGGIRFWGYPVVVLGYFERGLVGRKVQHSPQLH
jgi:hypothetical protein